MIRTDSSQSSTPCGRCKVLRDQLYTVGDERDRAIETRENANAVSARLEAENGLLREALRDLVAEFEAYAGQDAAVSGYYQQAKAVLR